jgi:DNA-directed RNA polymerase specialized sigma24 family protein
MYYKGFTKKQVADSLNISIDMVSTLLHQGMVQLYQRLNAFTAQK